METHATHKRAIRKGCTNQQFRVTWTVQKHMKIHSVKDGLAFAKFYMLSVPQSLRGNHATFCETRKGQEPTEQKRKRHWSTSRTAQGCVGFKCPEVFSVICPCLAWNLWEENCNLARQLAERRRSPGSAMQTKPCLTVPQMWSDKGLVFSLSKSVDKTQCQFQNIDRDGWQSNTSWFQVKVENPSRWSKQHAAWGVLTNAAHLKTP